MKVLLTAFTPFNKETINLSSEVLSYINDYDKIILDVVYDKVYFDLTTKFNLDEYDLIIAMGEARMRKELTLEIQAKNISSCSLADNSGVVKKEEVIVCDGSEVITTKVNLTNVEEIVKFSYDAGKFVCNNLCYHLLYNCPEKSLFIHIPYCESNQYEDYAKQIIQIINKIKENRGM